MRQRFRSTGAAVRSEADEPAIWLAIYLLPIVLIFVVATLVIRAIFKRLKALLG